LRFAGKRQNVMPPLSFGIVVVVATFVAGCRVMSPTPNAPPPILDNAGNGTISAEFNGEKWSNSLYAHQYVREEAGAGVVLSTRLTDHGNGPWGYLHIYLDSTSIGIHSLEPREVDIGGKTYPRGIRVVEGFLHGPGFQRHKLSIEDAHSLELEQSGPDTYRGSFSATLVLSPDNIAELRRRPHADILLSIPELLPDTLRFEDGSFEFTLYPTSP
jgi:hypothetical protein